MFRHPLVRRVHGRFVEFRNGYRVRSSLLRFGLLFFLFLSVGVFCFSWYYFGLTENGFVSCPTDSIGGVCYNPIYLRCSGEWCREYNDVEFLRAGVSFGREPLFFTKVLRYYVYAVVSLYLVILLVNHFAYNRRSKKV